MLKNNPGVAVDSSIDMRDNDYKKNIEQFWAIEEIEKSIPKLSDQEKDFLKNQDVFWAIDEMKKSIHTNN